jgi:transcriptional regulator NrdR family protein
LKCGICTSEDHRVVDTDETDTGIRRRRKCDRCGHRWTTWETSDRLDVDAVRRHLAALETLFSARG